MIKRKAMGVFALVFTLCLSLIPQRAQCEVFEYKYNKGDRYRILSVVNQEVFINSVLSHRAEILNRIAVEVTDARDGKGRHNTVFQTSERASYVPSRRGTQSAATGFQWTREYESVFERDKLGLMTIDPKYYMPVVRNVPLFPGKELAPGEKWNADGYEIHDFRDSFGIEQPYRIPFTANYSFLGERQYKGKSYPAFSVNYFIVAQPQAVRGRTWPKRITGSSDQVVYWDSKNGQAAAYEETYSLTFEMSDGRTIQFSGSAYAEVIESENMDKDKIVSEINEDIDRLKITDVNVKKVDEGVSISLEDVVFYADSAVMLPGEREKLDKIAEILKRYPERDIIVNGHTALAGTREGRQKLSEDRARAVADYLLSKDVRSADRMVIRGYGAEKPIADNRTEAGKRKNRRVEITILEN
ncbi:MAG: OmpA family protein [Treponema sp.]|jgi:outer membrane protein OmpA-like peptidoglycan-associated protein|nr:OmpA family protein [Treponema sp.]